MTRRSSDASDGERSGRVLHRPPDRNIRAMVELERQTLDQRSTADHLSSAIVRFTGSLGFVAANAAFFAVWILLNSGGVLAQPFDRFPYTLLTLVVSLEAIVLSIFVLMSANRMTRESDKRSRLDLQLDLLGEQELTAALHMLHAICLKLEVPPNMQSESLREMMRETDVNKIASALDGELPSE